MARRSGSGRRSTASTHPPRGRAGGGPGDAGRIMLDDGTPLEGKGYQEIPAGRRLVVHTPGGGGYGRSARRALRRRARATGGTAWRARRRRRRRIKPATADGREPH